MISIVLHVNDVLELVISNLQSHARFIIIDPCKTCNSKDQWLKNLTANSKGIIYKTDKSKYILKQEDYRQSALAKWMDFFRLRFNDEVKLAAHVWYIVIGSSNNSSYSKIKNNLNEKHNIKKKNILVIFPEQTDIDYFKFWIQKIGIERIFTLDSKRGMASERAMLSAFWYLQSALTLEEENDTSLTK